ncbi:biotin transporter BioY [Arachnia propionica]|uniref:biotin transporter BioY n=1 Tax=Arachnia propionica TaxID=1750 RepID=UPI0021ADA027|nr:biotin transporter BioY [Arachnia propionica]
MTATPAKSTFSFQATDLAHVGVFGALIAALAIVPGFQIGPVPFTLQTLGVALAGLCLGPIRGFAAASLYLVLGAMGLPVFNKGAAGIGTILGPTGGYLLSFPFAALLSGFVAMLVVRRGLSALTPFLLFGGLLLSRYLVILPFGVIGLMRALGKSFPEALAIDASFWLSDAIKSVVAVLLAVAVHRAFPRLLVQR